MYLLIGMENIAAHEHELTQYAMQRLKEIDGMRIFGEAEHKSSVISFLVGNIHHLDMGTLLDRSGHCRTYRASLCTAFDDSYGD